MNLPGPGETDVTGPDPDQHAEPAAAIVARIRAAASVLDRIDHTDPGEHLDGHPDIYQLLHRQLQDAFDEADLNAKRS